MPNSTSKLKYKHIPTSLDELPFNEFVLPHLSWGKRGPRCKVPLHRIFNYILYVLHTGVQWHKLPIQLDKNGKPEIHHTQVFRIFQKWSDDGSLARVFNHTVLQLKRNNKLDLNVIHGDGSSTPAKKGGDQLGYNGHKHFKGEKVVALVDRNVNVLNP